jgi:peptidoglycan/LPS O-acetylase OafA/YrhL
VNDTQVGAGPGSLPKLTSLRFFAAFWVLGFHALPREATAEAWSAFWGRGWMGVTFFFILSGFILTYTYGRRAGRLDRRTFWVARFARIYPTYLFAMVFAVPQLVHDAGSIGPQRLTGIVVSSLTLTQAWFGQYVCVWNCPSWSLSDEAFFYALFPLLVLLTSHRAGRALLLALTVGGMSAIAAGAAGSTSSVLLAAAGATLHPLARLPEFALGVWLGGVFLAHPAPWRAAPLVAVASALAIGAVAVWSGLHPELNVPHILAAPFFASLVIAVAASPNARSGLLASAPLVLLGEASYALYMLHGPLHGYALAAFKRVAPSVPAGLVFTVYAFAALALSVATCRWIERPMRRWLRFRLAPGP